MSQQGEKAKMAIEFHDYGSYIDSIVQKLASLLLI
jgi:hypothetical protein